MQDNTNWDKELRKIADLIAKAPLQKSIKWGAEVFTFNGRNVVSYGGFKNHFAIWFYNGVFLKDKYNILVSAQDGKTKSLRQWRFTSAGEIDEERIMEYLFEAIEVEKSGLKIAPERSSAFELNEVLKSGLKEDKAFADAFRVLTPGKQREYSAYIDEAKQEATKLSRLEKIKPQILEGKGLNDKYKK